MKTQNVRFGIAILAVIGLTACGNGEDIVATEEVDGAFAPVVEPLDRAAEVEALVDERKQALDDALKEAEAGDP